MSPPRKSNQRGNLRPFRTKSDLHIARYNRINRLHNPMLPYTEPYHHIVLAYKKPLPDSLDAFDKESVLYILLKDTPAKPDNQYPLDTVEDFYIRPLYKSSLPDNRLSLYRERAFHIYFPCKLDRPCNRYLRHKACSVPGLGRDR